MWRSGTRRRKVRKQGILQRALTRRLGGFQHQVFRHLALRQWHKSGVDIRGPAASALYLADAQARSQGLTAQPAILASFVTSLRGDEQVATAARKVGRIERRFEFIDQVADGFLGFRDPVALIKQLAGQPQRASAAKYSLNNCR